MKLKQLEIAGFKSFRERVILEFSAGITAVVGPNGCGKSNIVDAIRFAMGEHRVRNLRGKSMDEIIFNGSEDAGPAGLAEVSLILARGEQPFPGAFADAQEVMVTRRLYRGGESDYFLNKVPCRHLDVREFFMGTGVGARSYSLVEQNSVTLMVEAKPEEIRLYIDEAAGISKYKGRRESALRKLEATKQNMLRLQDILSEVKTSLQATARQARRAKQFKELRQEIREGEIILAWWEFQNLLAQREQLRVELEERRNEELQGQVQLQALESAHEATKLQVEEEEQEAVRIQERFFALKNALAVGEQSLAFTRQRLQELSDRERKIQEEQGAIVRRQLALKQESTELKAQASKAQEELDRLRRSIATKEKGLAESRLLFQALQRETEARRIECYNLATEKAKLENQILSLEKSHQELKRRRESLGREEAELAARERELEELLARLKNSLAADQTALEGFKERRRLAYEEEERMRQEVQEADERLAELKVDRGGKASRLQSMKEFRDSYAFLNEGARFLMKEAREGGKKRLNGFSPLGLMADFMDVPRKYEAAVEVALGEKLQYVAVSSYREALEAIGYLKTSSAGRGSFVPLEIQSEGRASVEQDFSGEAIRLVDVIGFKDGFQQLGELLLGDVFLVENLEEGLALRARGGRKTVFVSAEGDLITPEGVVTGGYSGNGQMSLLKNRREITELESALCAMDQEILLLAKRRKNAAAEVERWREEIADLRNAQHRMELQINGKKKDLERFGDESRRIKQRGETLAVNQAQLAAEIDGTLARREELRCTLAEKSTGESRLQAELVEVRRNWERLQMELQEKEKDLLGEKVALATQEQKREAAIKAQNRVDDSLATLASQSDTLNREMRECRVAMEELTAGQSAQESNLRELYREFQQLEETLGGLKERQRLNEEIRQREEKQLEELRTTLRKQAQTIGQLEASVRELSIKSENIREAIAGKYQLDLATWTSAGVESDFSPPVLKEQLEKKKEQLEKFGEVNLLALTEYEKLKERHDFLSAQIEDLQAASDSLNKTIARINRITRSQFSETFREVNTRFQEVFGLLFAGGRGRLLLTDEDDLLSTGVDMDIQLPGKRLQGLGLLSGGEKTLAALALIFAILRYRPAPFLILDEVDAALDDANVKLFSQLIRDLARKSQIIMVTHNKLSMEVADSLIGVTMQTQGLSSLISVNLQ